MDVLVFKSISPYPHPRPSSQAMGYCLIFRPFLPFAVLHSPSPFLHPPTAYVAVPIIDELVNEYIRLNLVKWTRLWKMAVSIAWPCRKIQCVLQYCAFMCEYMRRMWNCMLFVWVILICEVKAVHCTREMVTWTLPFVFFNPTTTKWPWRSSCVWGKAESWETVQWRSGQNLFATNCLPFVDVTVYLFIYFWCV